MRAPLYLHREEVPVTCCVGPGEMRSSSGKAAEPGLVPNFGSASDVLIFIISTKMPCLSLCSTCVPYDRRGICEWSCYVAGKCRGTDK